MSPHQTSPYQNVNDQFYVSDTWLAHGQIPSPQLEAKDEIRAHLNFGLHTSASSAASPPRSPYIGPRSAPVTYPIVTSDNPWYSAAMLHHSFSNNSFHDTMDPNLLSPIDIPRGSDTRSIDSPHASYNGSFVGQNNISHHDSFNSYGSSTVPEPFPPLEDSEYSVSPVIGPNWTLHSSTSMDRTASVLSNDSYFSQDTEDHFQFDDVSVTFRTDMADRSDFNDSIGSPISTPLMPPLRSANVKMGRKRKLSAAERESTAYMRKIGACETCYKRKLKVSDDKTNDEVG
jgi:hypothetical protein